MESCPTKRWNLPLHHLHHLRPNKQPSRTCLPPWHSRWKPWPWFCWDCNINNLWQGSSSQRFPLLVFILVIISLGEILAPINVPPFTVFFTVPWKSPVQGVAMREGPKARKIPPFLIWILPRGIHWWSFSVACRLMAWWLQSQAMRHQPPTCSSLGRKWRFDGV